jgi:hypothetical protein
LRWRPARARWKIENESFNVLKNNGYHREHNFGHGKQHLAQLFVLLNLLAFAFHTVCDSVERLWQEVRDILPPEKAFSLTCTPPSPICSSRSAYLVFGYGPGKCVSDLNNSVVTDRIPTVRTAAHLALTACGESKNPRKPSLGG